MASPKSAELFTDQSFAQHCHGCDIYSFLPGKEFTSQGSIQGTLGPSSASLFVSSLKSSLISSTRSTDFL